MTELLTRRQLRELERSGKLPEVSVASDPNPVMESPISNAPEVESPKQVLTRRELRELERSGTLPAAVAPVALPVVLPDVEVEDIEAASEELEKVVTAPSFLELDLPPADFTGSNLLAEPSTQSIVLEVSPEAIALPIETGEIAVTGSIAVLTEPSTGSITAGLDGLELDNADRQDSVTGVISIVEPISALDVINGRMSVGVVPKSVLRKGWWRPWAIGLASIIMAVAAILATVTILNAIGA